MKLKRKCKNKISSISPNPESNRAFSPINQTVNIRSRNDLEEMKNSIRDMKVMLFRLISQKRNINAMKGTLQKIRQNRYIKVIKNFNPLKLF